MYLNKETVDGVTDWRKETFPQQDRRGAWVKVLEELDEFIGAKEHDDEDFKEMCDLVITLVNYIDIRGWGDKINDGVEEKLGVLIDRDWHLREDGSGQHIE